MNFRSLRIEDYSLFKGFSPKNELSCENLFLNVFMWHDIYNYQLALYDNDTLVMRFFDGKKPIYYLPMGKNFFEATDWIFSNDTDAVFFASEGERFDRLVAKYGEKLEIVPIEENFEYIYNSSDLSVLPGKKFHQKRNHISAFSRKYNWRFEGLNDDNIADILEVTEKWVNERGNIYDRELDCEIKAIKNIVQVYKQLKVVGGILYVNETPIAFTFGCELNSETFDVTTEKALVMYQGAYAVINNEFAKTCLYPKYKYINREDDLGIEGLRRAKLSYHPEIILKKYMIKLKKENL